MQRTKQLGKSQAEYARKYFENNREKIAVRQKMYNTRLRHTSVALVLWRGARNRAKTKGLPFDLEIEDIIVPDVCPILKQSFVPYTKYAASLDKIDPSLGYVKGNVQVLSTLANRMKSDASVQELKDFAAWVLTL